MAAEKLTRPRLIQICCMLLLLIVAFVWRTLSYQQPRRYQCGDQNPCILQIEQHQVKVTKDENAIYLQITPAGSAISPVLLAGKGSVEQSTHGWTIHMPNSKGQLALEKNGYRYAEITF